MKDERINEINLLDVFKIIGRGIKSFFVGLVVFIGRLFQLAYRHIILLSIVLFLSLLVGQFLSRPSNRVYRVGAMAKLYGGRVHTVLEIGEQLGKSSHLYSNMSLESRLGLPQSTVRDIKRIDFFQVIDYQSDSIPDKVDFGKNHSLNDTVNTLMDNYVYVQFELKNVVHTDEIADKIVQYLNSNPILLENYQIYTDGLRERIALCELEIKRLDSVANKFYFEDRKQQLQFQDNQLIVGNQHIQLFYYDQLKLQEIKSKTEELLVAAKAPVVFPAGFVLDPKPLNGRLNNGIKSLILGVALGLLVAFFLENYSKGLNYLRRKE